MIMSMLKDIALWALVSGIFLAAYTVAFITISDPDEVSPDADTPITAPIWAMLGSFDNQEVGSWNGHVGQLMLWTYLVVSNILLVNLLIAMMGDTFGVIKEMADEEWKFSRLLSVVESAERMSATPPPLNLPITLSLFLWKMCIPEFLRDALAASPLGQMFSEDTEDKSPTFLKSLEVAQNKKRVVARKLLLALKAHEEEDNATSVIGRLEALNTNILEIEENVAGIYLLVDNKGSGTATPQTRSASGTPANSQNNA